MNLNETQIDNLVSFYFNINSGMDTPLILQAPSYIIEKWQKWICKIDESDYNPNLIPINRTFNEWEYRWGSYGDGGLKNSIISIIKFISVYESTSDLMNLHHLISLFEYCFPNVEINKIKGGVLHPLIDQYIDQYFNFEENIEYKKVYLRESYVNILTDQ